MTDDRLKRKLFGLRFKNPIGLAAGFDKNAQMFNELTEFGFGFIEIGANAFPSRIGTVSSVPSMNSSRIIMLS